MNQFHEHELTDADLAHLTGPRNYPDPCPWCGGRLIHNPLCDELRRSWELAMPFGKHRGKPLSQVPTEYLAWLVDNGGSIESELLTAIQARLGAAR